MMEMPHAYIWTFGMDDTLINAYLHQQALGNRVGGIFIAHELENKVNPISQ